MRFLLPTEQGAMRLLLRYAIPATASKLCGSYEFCGSCYDARRRRPYMTVLRASEQTNERAARFFSFC